MRHFIFAMLPLHMLRMCRCYGFAVYIRSDVDVPGSKLPHITPKRMCMAQLVHVKNRQEGTRGDRSTDNSRHVGAHRVHQQEVGRIIFRTHLL